MRLDQPTFSGGEISPEVAQRYDSAKYRTALQRGRNVLIAPTGGAYARPGFEFGGRVREVDRKARVIPFQFSVEQGYAVELGHLTLRIRYRGGLVLRPALVVTNITNDYPAEVVAQAHGYSVGDDLYFTGITGMVEINGQIARVITVLDANRVHVDLDTSGFGMFTGSTGGIVGDSLGGEGGYPAPPVTPPPPPPFEDVEPPPVIIDPGDIYFNFS